MQQDDVILTARDAGSLGCLVDDIDQISIVELIDGG